MLETVIVGDWKLSELLVLAACSTAFVVLFASSAYVVAQYEVGVLFRNGRLRESSGPGLHFLVPMVDRLELVDTRVRTLCPQGQDVITRDNVTVTVSSAVYFRVADARKAVTGVDDYLLAVSRKAETSLRIVLGQHTLDELLQQQDKIDAALASAIGGAASDWGLEVRSVEIRDIVLPEEMRRAMAQVAEADRERSAKVIAADGELQASEKLSQAAARMGK